MASPAEVDAAFRLLIGRPPDPAESAQWQAVPAGGLRAGLMATGAFRLALPADAVRMRLDLPASPVAWQADPATEAALLARVQARWTRLGEERPHWSVNARPEFAPDRIAANHALFEASGEGDLDVLLSVLARHGLTPADLPRACDFGCGVGRMTAPMRRRFAVVTGCDVSVPHLALARAAVGAGVTFALVAAPEFGMAAPFDLWFSTVTLQHNPPPVIAAILRRAFALLAPGGVAVFQLPTEREGYAFDPAAYLAAPDGPDPIEIHALPQSAVFGLAAQAGCVPLEVREDCVIWPPTSCISNRFVFCKPGVAATP